MMRWIYDLGFFVFAVFSLPHFLGRLRQAKNPTRLIRERFGFFSEELISRLKTQSSLWIHGVSVGEVLAVEKLLSLILEKRPDLHVVLTTVTPTGQQMAERWASERVSVLYFPFDFRFAVSRFFEVVRPTLLLLVETEVWPNVIREAGRHAVPVGLVNGRLSERSFQAFQRFSWIFKALLVRINFFLVQTEKDRERLVALGVDEAKVTVTGNMKLDLFDLNGQERIDRQKLREEWGFSAGDQVLVGGSTHAGEEEILLRVVRRLRGEGYPLKLFLAPRHVERSSKVLGLAREWGFEAVLASARDGRAPYDVVILDRLGELRRLYLLGDAVLMGGSLVRHGGQNPAEPASASRPIIHGPWVFNFQEIYRQLDEEGASLRVKGEEELFFVLKRILKSEPERRHLGNQAYELLRKLRGATERNFTHIEEVIKKCLEVNSKTIFV